jgi:hypothetical protein
LDSGAIAVSKLCCPVCWELLQILKHHAKDLQVRGHHPTVYRLALPPWLSRDVIQQVVDKFKITLRKELEIMVNRNMNPTTKTHSRHPYQTDSGNHPELVEREDSDDDQEYLPLDAEPVVSV